MAVCFFFDKTNQQIQKAYDNLFSGGGKGNKKLKRWGWYNSLYQAGKGDIFKMQEIEKEPFYTVMTFLSYEKDFYYKPPKTKQKK